MKHLKVYYVIDSYEGPTGGTEKQLLMLIEGLRAQQHEARLFVLRHTPYTRSVTDFPCPIVSLEIGSIRSATAAQRMLAFRRRLRTERPDVVHAFFNDSAILVPIFANGAGARVFTSRRDMGFWYTRLNLTLLRLANRRTDRIVCNCRAVAEETGRRERLADAKLSVIYNGLALDGWGNTGSEPMAADVDASEPPRDEVRVCLLANLRPIKRIEDFIRAAALVAKEAPAARFLVVGESLSASYEAELNALVDELALGDRLRFNGPTTDPASLLGRYHIGVLTSESEGLSNSVLEYMAAGLPVVCSDVGGNSELVEHGRNGYLYPARNIAALARHLTGMCTSAGERDRLGKASLVLAQAFSPDRMIEAHLDEYRQGRGSYA
jgi:glycosyltransferase involved in cell wall biosynthesis